jgi:phosphatidylinositol alpha 1,6-mannosyltransferase
MDTSKRLPGFPRRACDQLRVALFSGNYNCVKDGANQALNRLVGYLERQGAAVRVYSPTVQDPAFEPAGTLVSVPSVPVPRRSEYRVALGLTPRPRADLERFRPNILHVSAPDPLGYAGLKFADANGIPVVGSVHTRFETYFKYYALGGLEGWVRRYLTHFYNRCRQVYVPSDCMVKLLRGDGVTSEIRTWSRGVDRTLFNPSRRDLDWRRSLGIADDEVVILFVGRVVMEKGLKPFADTLERLASTGIPHRILVVGDGPAREWLAQRLPKAVFTGYLSGENLARAYASSDVFFNPSTTETFGNVTIEAMASGLPTVCARATGSNSIVRDGETGFLIDQTDTRALCGVLGALASEGDMRRGMGVAARDASAVYDWEAVLSAVHRHYVDARASHAATAPAIEPAPVPVFARNSSEAGWSL